MKHFIYIPICVAAIIYATFPILGVSQSSTSQDLKKKALADPLSCALYLLQEDEIDGIGGDSLTESLFKVGRYDDALKAENLKEKDGFSRSETFNKFAETLLLESKRSEALKFINASYDLFLNEDTWNERLLGSLVRVGRADEALRLIDSVGKGEFDSADEVDGKKIDYLRSITHAFLADGHNLNALQTLNRISELMSGQPKDAQDYIRRSESMAIYFYRAGNRSRANEIFEGMIKFAMTFSDESDPDRSERDYIFRGVFRIYLLIDELDRALIAWEKIEDKRPDDRFKLAEEFIKVGRNEDARKEIKILEGQEMADSYIAKIWLLLNEPENAIKAAIGISKDGDSYEQQAVFMLIADHFTKNGQKEKALDILLLSFSRIKPIVYEHNVFDSIGASTGSRKEIYINNIFTRYIKLGEDKKALEVAKAIDADHSDAKAAFALNLAIYAKLNYRSLEVGKILKLKKEAFSVLEKAESEYDEIFVKQNFAEALALKGKIDKAADILAELIESNIDKSYEVTALLTAGEVFDKYMLPATSAMRGSLAAVLEHHGL